VKQKPHWSLRHCATCGEPLNLRSDMIPYLAGGLPSACDRCKPRDFAAFGWTPHACAICGAPFYAPDFNDPDLPCQVCHNVTQENRPMAAKKNSKGPATKTIDGRKLVERARYEQMLPCKIPVDEVEVKAGQLAKVIRERDEMLDRKRESNAAYREKIAFFDERLKELATSVENKTEQQSVSCVEWLVPETNEIRVIREDTGEIVETRTADAQDLQDPLPFEKKKRKGNEVEETADVE
jgi:hypothetical protein